MIHRVMIAKLREARRIFISRRIEYWAIFAEIC